MKKTISPSRSLGFGLCWSVITFLLVGAAVLGLFKLLDLGQFGHLIGVVGGLAAGLFAGFKLFDSGITEVPLNWIGLGQFLGKLNGDHYENGTHWVSPFHQILNCPGDKQIFIIVMPGERINAQDGIPIFFGVDDPAHPGKHNGLQYSVINPELYIGVDDPEDALREEFIEKARLFFGQMTKAIAVKNIKLLFNDWICLPNQEDMSVEQKEQHSNFRLRLDAAQYDNTVKLFEPDAVEALMQHAGEFVKSVDDWGIGKIAIFTPNVRVNPVAEAAAARKQEALEDMSTLETRMTKISTLTAQFKDESKVNPDLAAAIVASQSGKPVTIESKTINVSGLPDVLERLGTMAINAYRGKKGAEQGDS